MRALLMGSRPPWRRFGSSVWHHPLMTRRHLTAAEAIAAVRRGRQVEQWLGAEDLPGDRRAIKWLTWSGSSGRFTVVSIALST
jgi:hypothetical protein